MINGNELDLLVALRRKALLRATHALTGKPEEYIKAVAHQRYIAHYDELVRKSNARFLERFAA